MKKKFPLEDTNIISLQTKENTALDNNEIDTEAKKSLMTNALMTKSSSKESFEEASKFLGELHIR